MNIIQKFVNIGGADEIYFIKFHGKSQCIFVNLNQTDSDDTSRIEDFISLACKQIGKHKLDLYGLLIYRNF